MTSRMTRSATSIDLSEDGRYLIAVAGDAFEIDDQMRLFHEAMAISFGFLATLMALMMFFQTRLVRVSTVSVADA